MQLRPLGPGGQDVQPALDAVEAVLDTIQAAGHAGVALLEGAESALHLAHVVRQAVQAGFDPALAIQEALQAEAGPTSAWPTAPVAAEQTTWPPWARCTSRAAWFSAGPR